MKYIIASKNLNKRLQILEATFEENNLKVMATACKPFSDYNGDLYVYVELSTISGRRIKNDIHLKINLYDVDGNPSCKGTICRTMPHFAHRSARAHSAKKSGKNPEMRQIEANRGRHS